MYRANKSNINVSFLLADGLFWVGFLQYFGNVRYNSTVLDAFCRDSESDEPLWTVRYQARLILCECYTPNLPQRLGVRTLNQWFVLPNRLGLWNTPTDSLQRAKTPLPTSVLSRRVPPTNKCPGYDTKQSDGEVPVMLEFWGMRSTLSLPSLPGLLWPGVVAPNKGPIYGLNRTKPWFLDFTVFCM